MARGRDGTGAAGRWALASAGAEEELPEEHQPAGRFGSRKDNMGARVIAIDWCMVAAFESPLTTGAVCGRATGK